MRRINMAFAVPVGVVGIVLLLVMPIPAVLLDLLIVVNILFTLVILLTSLFVKKPLDFSVFPSLLLIATIFRLGLNVASTRLVLGQGNAGQVIAAMGHVAINGSLVIGLVVFAILVVIQFVVVTKGAERVAEVGARFTLDAMPGKQMAIDADLNSGLITDTQARERRAEVAAEADFYGAMDGASKFVKGDAIAGIVIILINGIGGIIIGMVQNGLDIMTAINTYTLLTVGDGLVTQIPALLMAVSTGVIVTRANSDQDLGTSAGQQLLANPIVLRIAGVAAIIMGLIPGMPILLFAAIGVALLIVAQRLIARRRRESEAQTIADAPTGPVSDTTDDLIESMRVPALEIRLSADLVGLVSGGSDDLIGRVRALRRKIASDLGIVVPPVRTRDHPELGRSQYAILIAGVEVGAGIAPTGKVLALGDTLDALPGDTVVDPVFGMPGKWIPTELRHSAELAGATVIDRTSVLVTHLQSVITQNAARLLTREDVRVLTEAVRRDNPSAVEELVPAVLTLAEVQRVLQGLLAEQVPINDLGRIYEALALRARTSTDPEGLIEAARGALGAALATRHLENGRLRLIMLAPDLEQSLLEALRGGELGSQLLLDPARLDALLSGLRDTAQKASAGGEGCIVACAPALRPAISRLVQAQGLGLPVLSYQEVTAAQRTIETVGVVTGVDAVAA